jgi:hypothetical protein
MSHHSCKPISSLIFKLFSDRNTPFEPQFEEEQKYASRFQKSIDSSWRKIYVNGKKDKQKKLFFSKLHFFIFLVCA